MELDGSKLHAYDTAISVNGGLPFEIIKFLGNGGRYRKADVYYLTDEGKQRREKTFSNYEWFWVKRPTTSRKTIRELLNEPNSDPIPDYSNVRKWMEDNGN